jgi:hypothetical protein
MSDPANPDEQTAAEVSARLGKSVRWLQDRLQHDPSLHFHHYLGRTRRWDEAEFQQLRTALRAIDTAKHRTPAALPPSFSPQATQDDVDALVSVLRGRKKAPVRRRRD